MDTKTSAFIKLLADWYRDKVNAGLPTTWHLCLLNATVASVYGKVWADVSALECSFKGYSRQDVTAALYNLATEPISGKWQVKTNPLNFAYSSAGSGLSSEDAYAWALIHSDGGSEKLMEVKALLTPKTFAVDGDELPIEHIFNSKNCNE